MGDHGGADKAQPAPRPYSPSVKENSRLLSLQMLNVPSSQTAPSPPPKLQPLGNGQHKRKQHRMSESSEPDDDCGRREDTRRPTIVFAEVGSETSTDGDGGLAAPTGIDLLLLPEQDLGAAVSAALAPRSPRAPRVSRSRRSVSPLPVLEDAADSNAARTAEDVPADLLPGMQTSPPCPTSPPLRLSGSPQCPTGSPPRMAGASPTDQHADQHADQDDPTASPSTPRTPPGDKHPGVAASPHCRLPSKLDAAEWTDLNDTLPPESDEAGDFGFYSDRGFLAGNLLPAFEEGDGEEEYDEEGEDGEGGLRNPRDSWAPAVDSMLGPGVMPDSPSNLRRRNGNRHPRKSLVMRFKEITDKTCTKRERIIREFFDTERAYVDNISAIRNHYVYPLRLACILDEDVVKKIFCNLEDIVRLNTQLLEEMRSLGIGRAFCKVAPYMKLYSLYAQNFDDALKTLHMWKKKSPKFDGFCAAQNERSGPMGKTLGLEAMLLLPIQRVPRYRLLMQELVEATPVEHVECGTLREALERIQFVAAHIDSYIDGHRQHFDIFSVQRSLQGENVPQLVEPGRKLIKQGNLSELSAINRQIRTRRVFVFNDAIVTTKQSTKSSAKSSTKSSTKRTTYTFKSMLDFAKCQVLLCKMDHNLAPLKTHIEIQSDRQALVLFAATPDETLKWFDVITNAIRDTKALYAGAAACEEPHSVGRVRQRGASCPHSPASVRRMRSSRRAQAAAAQSADSAPQEAPSPASAAPGSDARPKLPDSSPTQHSLWVKASQKSSRRRRKQFVQQGVPLGADEGSNALCTLL